MTACAKIASSFLHSHRMQLDIFDHGRDTMLRNDVAGALEQRDAAAARAAQQQLQHEYPHDLLLAPQAVLIAALGERANAPFAEHAALREARLALERRIEPAAALVFGPMAGAAWAAPLWGSLARRAERLAWRADSSDDHAAPLWLRAGDAAAAAAAVERIESWRRIPVPLGWMLQARHRTHGLEAAWPLLAELAWLAPARLDALLPRLADPVLERLHAHFDAGFEGAPDGPAGHDGAAADLAWFPAWVLVEKPALAGPLGAAQPSHHTPPEQALRLLVELLGLEHQGRHHDLVRQRKRLRDLQPCLYRAYMSTR
jgi:hypothetical protein